MLAELRKPRSIVKVPNIGDVLYSINDEIILGSKYASEVYKNDPYFEFRGNFFGTVLNILKMGSLFPKGYMDCGETEFEVLISIPEYGNFWFEYNDFQTKKPKNFDNAFSVKINEQNSSGWLRKELKDNSNNIPRYSLAFEPELALKQIKNVKDLYLSSLVELSFSLPADTTDPIWNTFSGMINTVSACDKEIVSLLKNGAHLSLVS